MRCRARQISIQNQSWALPQTCQFCPRSEQEPILHQPQRAQLSFTTKIHKNLGHCMESIPKPDIARFITRSILCNKVHNGWGKKPTTSHGTLWRWWWGEAHAQIATGRCFKISGKRKGPVVCDWETKHFRITLRAKILLEIWCRWYWDPPEVAVLPYPQVCRHTIRLPRRGRPAQNVGNQWLEGPSFQETYPAFSPIKS